MGLLIDGVWHEQWYDTSSTGGRFIRKDSIYRNWVTADGAAGQAAVQALLPKPGDITYMSVLPVPGPTAR